MPQGMALPASVQDELSAALRSHSPPGAVSTSAQAATPASAQSDAQSGLTPVLNVWILAPESLVLVLACPTDSDCGLIHAPFLHI